jgi:hypothetical protein
MFTKIKDEGLLNYISSIKSKINIRKIDNSPRGEYLLTYSIKNGEAVRLIFVRYQDKNYSILYNFKTRDYSIVQLRFSQKVFDEQIEMYGDIKDNTLFLHAAYIEKCSLLDNLELLDKLLYTDYKEDLDMENLHIKIKEFYSSAKEIKSLRDAKINGILYLNNYLDKQHYIEFLHD